MGIMREVHNIMIAGGISQSDSRARANLSDSHSSSPVLRPIFSPVQTRFGLCVGIEAKSWVSKGTLSDPQLVGSTMYDLVGIFHGSIIKKTKKKAPHEMQDLVALQ